MRIRSWENRCPWPLAQRTIDDMLRFHERAPFCSWVVAMRSKGLLRPGEDKLGKKPGDTLFLPGSNMLLEEDLVNLDNGTGDDDGPGRELLGGEHAADGAAVRPRSKAMAEEDMDLDMGRDFDFGVTGTMRGRNLAAATGLISASSVSLSAMEWKSTLPKASKAFVKLDLRTKVGFAGACSSSSLKSMRNVATDSFRRGRSEPAGEPERKFGELIIARCTPFSSPNFAGD
mmetsp:Transcript_66687/g.191659  ORF Transcript_66687/g.191659 Transcript_66687/m.191659 type:complete len:230 (+) Transcript_66687:59-748(+)